MIRVRWWPAAVGVPWVVWLARDLAPAWRAAPYDRSGGIIFLIWLIGVSWMVWRHFRLQISWWVVSVFLLVLGRFGDLNALIYIGGAGYLLSFGGALAARCAALVVALSWMPLTGWFLRDMGVDGVVWIRWFWLTWSGGLFIFMVMKSNSHGENK